MKKPQGLITFEFTDSFEDTGASAREDFDSITFFAEDVVKLTDFQLNLVLAEGGGEHAKNRFGDNKRKIIPQFHPLQDVVFINPRPKAVSKMG